LDLSSEIPKKEKYFAYSYLQFFICIEEYLKIKEIFDLKDNKCYVNKSILVARKDLFKEQWTSSIKFVEKQNPSHYILKENLTTKLNPNQTDFKMSSVLIYFFNLNTSNSKNWPKIREIRNQKAAHPEQGNVTQENIIQLLDFLFFIFNSKNSNTEGGKISLPDISTSEELKKLQEYGLQN
jgi:hypothetical protein